MSHVRAQLRAAVVSALTGLAATGARVFASREYPISSPELPCWCVYMTSESAENLDTLEDALHEQVRTIAVELAGYAQAGSALDDTLDEMARQAEVALSGTLTVGAKTLRLVYTGSNIDMSVAGGVPAGCITLQYSGILHTASNAPDVAI